MPRFFFHIRDGADLIKDTTGIELEDLDAARHEALRTAGCLIGDLGEIGDSTDGQTFEICDAHGDVLDVVSFKEALRL